MPAKKKPSPNNLPGRGIEYQPHLTVRQVASVGLSQRIQSRKPGRVHHFLSKLEVSYFYILEWSTQVVDIREQFPLFPLEETQAIAATLGFRHPTQPRTQASTVLTTDFVVTIEQAGKQVDQARTIKYSKDLQSSRVLEKLEIERCYWQARGTDWGIVTEHEIPKTLVKNLEWLRPWYDFVQVPHVNQRLHLRIQDRLRALNEDGTLSLSALALKCDDELGLESGTSLAVAKHAFATRLWLVDLDQPLHPNRPVKWTLPQ